MNYKVLIISIILILSSCSVGELIDPSKSNSFYTKNGNVYYSPNGNWFELGYTKCEFADLETFVVLSESIGKDKDNIYYEYKPQEHIDYNSFFVDDSLIPKDKDYAYEGSGQHNTLKEIIIPNVDVKSLTYTNDCKSIRHGWAKDKFNYYFKLIPVEIDYNSLIFLTEDFFYDKDSLYTDLNDWKIANIKSLRSKPVKITSKYILSDSELYFVGVDSSKKIQLKRIEVHDPNDIIVLNNSVIKDREMIVYYGEEFIPSDIESFQVINDSEFGYHMKYYKDIINVYLDKIIITDADPLTFEVIKLGFAKDKNNVYHNHAILRDVDVNSCKERKFGQYGDAKGNIFDWNGNRIE